QLRAPRQAQAAQFVAAHVATAVALDIGGVMGQSENVSCAKLGAQNLCVGGQTAIDQVIAQQAEFVHREAVSRWQWRAVVVVKYQRQGHRLAPKVICSAAAASAARKRRQYAGLIAARSRRGRRPGGQLESVRFKP